MQVLRWWTRHAVGWERPMGYVFLCNSPVMIGPSTCFGTLFIPRRLPTLCSPTSLFIQTPHLMHTQLPYINWQCCEMMISIIFPGNNVRVFPQFLLDRCCTGRLQKISVTPSEINVMYPIPLCFLLCHFPITVLFVMPFSRHLNREVLLFAMSHHSSICMEPHYFL